MKYKGAGFLLAGVLVGVLIGATILFIRNNYANPPSTPRLPPTVGSPVKDFTLQQLNGKSLKLSDFQGKPVLINFWATWCPPCKEEMPLLERYAVKYKDRLVVLGVDYEDTPDIIQQYVKTVGVTFPILLDRNGAVADTYYVRDFPISFFVDPNGIIRAQHLGALTEDELQQYLKTIGVGP